MFTVVGRWAAGPTQYLAETKPQMLRLFCIVLIMLCVFVVFLSSDVAHLRTGVRASSIAEQWQYAHHIVLRDSFLSFFVCVCR